MKNRLSGSILLRLRDPDNHSTTYNTPINIDLGQRHRANLHASPPLLLRVSETAELLSISRSTAYRLIRTGELPSIKVGGAIRVPYDQLCDWVAEHTVMREAA